MPSYSKGARGLSVLLRVTGIFTGVTVSLSPWLSPVFLVNSRSPHFTATPFGSDSKREPVSSPDEGTPSPEVTVLFCRVP